MNKHIHRALMFRMDCIPCLIVWTHGKQAF